MHSLKIIHKLFILAGILIAFLFLLGTISYLNLSYQEKKIDEIVNVDFAELEDINEIIRRLQDLHAEIDMAVRWSILGYMTAAEAKELVSNQLMVVAQLEEDKIRQVLAENETGAEEIESLVRQKRDWLKAIGEVLPIDAELANIYMGSADETMIDLVEKLEQIAENRKKEVDNDFLEVQEKFTNVIITFVVIYLSSIVIAIFAAFLIGRSIIIPIRQLSKGAEHIGKGDLDYKLEIKTNDEIGQLANSFRGMTRELKGSTTSIDNLNKEIEERKAIEEEVKQYTQDLEVLNNELVKSINTVQEKDQRLLDANEELNRANKELKKIDQVKSNFVSHVSHEFKNPLFIAQDSLGVILNEEAGNINIKQRKMLDFTKNSVDRLLRLVVNLLDISKIEAGKMKLNVEKVDLMKAIIDVLKNSQKSISEKQIILKTNFSKNIGFLWGDKDRLTEVVINLLSNAVKYTPVKGTIGVKLEGTEEKVRFEIANTGGGIAREDREKIFDKFERVTAESQEGTGLGLPIVKDIIELHKGKIWVESEMGRGSTFIFTIPKDLRN